MNTQHIVPIGYQHWNGDGDGCGDGHRIGGDGWGDGADDADLDPYTLDGNDVLPSGDGVGTGPTWEVKFQRPGDGCHLEIVR